ncbi:MAG: 3-deoxy-manno-octulosonate cytidylyltransferase [Gammaproteobacteria bacterium]|nr:3-deoxy-manno-octulosonate cytidylyltransferase [Gammaproteobacteria bacterium]MBT8123931.1 3-deoxy-manno-octulosonate cytidylyltransferase [Gammaproteobacteria bacterium]NNC67725.1 3-deoxy-manno-octulosonate cytidylyltransferase [Gammaproteobacteria bacterium]
MSFKVVIPARYASKRLPGKALLILKDKPIVQYVYENACASGADEVIIATDDQRIVDAAKKFNAKVCLTSDKHTSGTDRIAEVAELSGWGKEVVIVNVQGDEPQMPATNIKQVAQNLFSHEKVSMSTLCAPITDNKDFDNPNVVKVIFDANNLALNFSRVIEKLNCKNPITHRSNVYRHLGIYAYRVGFLNTFTSLPPSSFEIKESLEQLRALQNGHQIFVEVCKQTTGIGVDTQDDYDALLKSI